MSINQLFRVFLKILFPKYDSAIYLYLLNKCLFGGAFKDND